MENLHDKQSKTNEQQLAEEKRKLIQEAVSIVKRNHEKHRSTLIQDLTQRTREDLIRGFQIEMDAKNQAYYFILESGYFEEFRKYCQHSSSSR